MLDTAVFVDGASLEPPPGLLDRLRQLDGYTWDESRESFRSSYDIWHISGTKRIGGSTRSSLSSRLLENASPRHDISSNSKRQQDEGSRREESVAVGRPAVEIVARISVHTLREERAYYICKTLVSAVDPNGYHIIRPLEILRLASQDSNNGPMVVCIFEYAGPNYLSRVVDYGPGWYNLRGEDLHASPNEDFVAEPITLQIFLDFAIGAAECIEVLHGQQIVHGEVRGDTFHWNIETGKIRLIHLGAGLRTFEQGLTSTGWSKMSREHGARTKLSYMSPEQTGRMPIEPDSRTDIFSLGLLFWTMLVQKPAFEGETPMDVIQAVLGKRLPLVSNVRLDIPEVISRIIQKATAKSVSDRYHSMSGLRHDLTEVRKLLGTGDFAQLQNLDIGTKDVSPSFILPEVLVGRAVEHDTVVKVIDHAFRLRQVSKVHDKRNMNHLSRLSEGQFSGFDMAFTAGDASLEDDDGSSADGGTNSIPDVVSGDPKTYQVTTSQLRPRADSHQNSVDSDRKSPDKRISANLDSLSAADSMNGESGGPRSSSDGVRSLIIHRSQGSIRIKGRCEVITIAGAAGLGKSRLIHSVQIEARRRGYFASSKFDQAEKTPFGPVLKLLSSLFQQVFSESNMDPVFHQILKQHVTSTWSVLHKVLNLPEFLLGPSMGFNSSLGPEAKSGDSSPGHAGPMQDFLRAGSSMKSLPLMNTVLDVLRIFARYKFICFCLDDLHFADEESLELLASIISTRIKMVIIVTFRPEDISSEKMRAIINPLDDEGMENHKVGDIGVTRVALKPLNQDDIMEYVAATIRRPKADILPLCSIIQSRTGGNPFYIREMLDACHRKKCIWYDYRESGWLFDQGRIFKEFKIENFDETMHADFVTSRLNALPAASRTILAWASMLGASFSFQLIQRLLSGEFAPGKQERQSDDRSTSQLSLAEQDLVKGLQAAIQACIVVPTHDDDVFCFAHDRYLQAAITLRNGDENWMHFVMTQLMVKYYSNDDKYQNVIASSICESISTIKRSVAQRRYFRKLLLTYAHTACENGLRSTASKLYGSCIGLLQDDMWNNEADDVYYEETLHVHTAAAECCLYRGQYQDAKRLLLSVSSNAMTAIDKAPSWILQSRLFAQEGDSTSAFQALKICLVALDVEVDDNPTFQKCDTEFRRLCQEIQSIDADTLIKKPIAEESTLAAVGAVLVECSTAAFWSDTLTFYQMTLIMVNTYLSSNSFPQAGMGFLQLALIAITRHNMIKFANDCGNVALGLIERWKDPYTIGRGGTIYPTFVGHIQHHLQASINQLEGALEFAIQAGDRPSTILNFGLAGNLKFFASENLADLESFCTYGCQDIPNWESDTPGGTMIITIRQVCRALQGKTITANSQGVMSDEHHNSHRYKSWLVNTVKNYDRPLMLYESIEIAPLFLYGHYSSAVALGNSCLKKINAMWSARNSRFLMFFHALSLAGSIWIRVEEQLDPVYRNQSPQLSSDIKGRSFEAGLQDEIEGLAMLMKYFKKRIEQWQVVTDVNYLAWSKLLAAQISEMEDDYTNALRLYEEAIDHASTQHFTFEEALANNLLGGCLLRLGSRRLAKTAFLEAITLYRQFGATGVASHIENQHHLILREPRTSVLTTEVGIQTDPDETLGMIDPHITGFGQHDSQIPESLLGTRIGMWQDGSAPVNTDAGPALHMLDLTSILESSQVISSVLQVEELLKTMCEIILQNCKGVASLAAIVIEEDQPLGWVIAASGNEEGAEAHNPPLSLKESALIAESVVNYCTRFRETVFLPDLIQDQRFSNVNDTWVVRNPSSKSVVAIPICHGEGKPLLGVLYLEGQPNAFTNRSLEVLHLLVNQIGISYSNALTLKEVERVSAINKSMVDVQKKALSEAITAKAEALRNAQLAEEAAKAKTTFLANISHELRTPLNGVIGNSELLLDSQLQKQQAEMADSIRVSADLLLSLINDILDFSKIEAHKMQLHITAFNTNEMIQEIVRSIPTDHKKKLKDVRIIQDIHLPQSLVYGDPVRLHQILLNLASNSKKFTEKGSITIGAKLEWETTAAVHLTFWIKDTGIGIPAQQQHKLFKPFSQADASTARKYGGSGLGLSICKSLIESMGGTIKLESTENVGTTVSFSLTLPKAKPEASASENQKEPGSIDTVSSTEELVTTGHTNLSEVPHSQLRACIAEDNPINQKIALQFLQKLKFEVVDVYDNGLLAVEGIRRKAQEGQPYHVVLMDVQMPVLDGYEATKLLRNDSSDVVRGILVIALTASAVQGDKEKCLASGMNDYLAKPVRLAVLKKKFALYMQVE